MQKQRNLLSVCIWFAFSPGTTSALMITFTRQQYLIYAPTRKNAKTNSKNNVKIKQKTCEKKTTHTNVKNKQQTRTATCL